MEDRPYFSGGLNVYKSSKKSLIKEDSETPAFRKKLNSFILLVLGPQFKAFSTLSLEYSVSVRKVHDF